MNLEELKLLHAAATQGEWRNKDTAAWAHPTAYVESVDCGHSIARLSLDLTCTVGKYEREVENATYIAALHNAFPAIVAKLEAAQRQTAWLVENGESPPKFRAMEQGLSVWVSDPNLALRFARRVDGEMFANEDEDAWFVREHMWVDAPAAFDKEQQ